ncbi:hypothetical protein OEZ85_008531 [Tetradesmus obliquus]|uniref:Uncharacterized protein n=1 Tax=Tetradesmus obliquus TaxID=3088 RepID=A0ABY8TJ41_TETOB|nr:hypothetical protein OEZ85_008531 [Tetradesmus obliquus]
MQTLASQQLQARSSAKVSCKQAVLTGQVGRRVTVRAANDSTGQATSSNVCKTCGVDLSKAPGGCDGEGRIVGGLGAVPGFGWWPIKAYRPCPGLSSAGMEYVRKGQPTNEMLFGGVSLSENQQESLVVMKETADKGIQVDV